MRLGKGGKKRIRVHRTEPEKEERKEGRGKRGGTETLFHLIMIRGRKSGARLPNTLQKKKKEKKSVAAAYHFLQGKGGRKRRRHAFQPKKRGGTVGLGQGIRKKRSSWLS